MLARLMWPLLTRKIFGPASVPKTFEAGLPKEMPFHPSQIRASAAESALMIPAAFAARGHYAELKMPVVIIAEEEQAHRYRGAVGAPAFRIAQQYYPSRARCWAMVHQTAPDSVMVAIEPAASADAAGHANVVSLPA